MANAQIDRLAARFDEWSEANADRHPTLREVYTAAYEAGRYDGSRVGGLKGGPARAAALSAARRSEIARIGAYALVASMSPEQRSEMRKASCLARKERLRMARAAWQRKPSSALEGR